jgi:hypothetical protein
VPIEIDHARVHVGWPPSSTLNHQFGDDVLTQLLVAARKAQGASAPSVVIEHDCQRATGKSTLAAQEIANRTRRLRALVQQSRKDPRILYAIEILGAHVREVRVPDHLK